MVCRGRLVLSSLSLSAAYSPSGKRMRSRSSTGQPDMRSWGREKNSSWGKRCMIWFR